MSNSQYREPLELMVEQRIQEYIAQAKIDHLASQKQLSGPERSDRALPGLLQLWRALAYLGRRPGTRPAHHTKPRREMDGLRAVRPNR
ncbi:MAG: hypothetical protein ACM3JD_16745 [Rudaea sp.]